MENLFRSIQALQKLLIEADIASIVIGGVAVAAWGEPRLTRDVDLKFRRQGDALDDGYIVDWLKQFEQALDDSTLVHEFKNLRQGLSGQ
jgi:hypothetical protein